MITIFCAFFTLLTCVSGVTVVTQSPLITVRKGEQAKLDCNLGTVTNRAAAWYKQTPGGVPQHVLRFYHSWSSVEYGSGFSAPKFTSTHSSKSDYSLIINNVDVDDSAVYYCQTWDSSSFSSLYEYLIVSYSLHLFTKLNLLITVKMLMIFYCITLTLLSSVRCAKVVTQKPSILTKQKGKSVTLDCNIEKDQGYYVSWYKQILNAAPQYVLRYYQSHSSPGYGDGFTSSHFTSKAQSNIDYQLIINVMDVDDSAVYYCGTWDSSVFVRLEHVKYITVVFGQGTKLIVTDAAAAAPVLNILRPSREELSSSKVTLVCLINHMSAAFADVRWLVNGNSVTEGVFTGSAEQQPDKKFKMSSSLTIESSEWDKDTQLTCEAITASKTISKSIKKSDCSD
ncbi:hypothetical protein Q8A67_000304 [Cirrhinus molitorella]|uniref:Ig-like domain-containing protein n=1 Tax=Cirrhinus molitorella TaxID=172907 RepID=A0AA88QFI0_9TELE|nr:hypothetical protein Q8A67_000304 [Cirrhinus molitorella]